MENQDQDRCSRCNSRAFELRSINDGPKLCNGCYQAQQDALAVASRQPSPERVAAYERSKKLADELAVRPPQPEIWCSNYHKKNGHNRAAAAVALHDGFHWCSACLSEYLAKNPSANKPVGLIADLLVRVAALETKLAERATARKGA